MSEESKREEAAKLQRMERDLKRKQEDSQAEVTRRLNAGLESMQKEIAPLVTQVAKEKGLNLVLLNNPNTGIFYFDSTVDITNDVIKKYDEMQHRRLIPDIHARLATENSGFENLGSFRLNHAITDV